MILTGADGQLKHNGVVISKIRNWSMTANKAAIETTTLGLYDRTYINGLRGATGSASMFYDPSDAKAVEFLNTIFTQSSEEKVDFIFDRLNNGEIEGQGFITSIGASVSVGEAQACEIQFQFSGPVNGTF
jgi:hypothetical protein